MKMEENEHDDNVFLAIRENEVMRVRESLSENCQRAVAYTRSTKSLSQYVTVKQTNLRLNDVFYTKLETIRNAQQKVYAFWTALRKNVYEKHSPSGVKPNE